MDNGVQKSLGEIAQGIFTACPDDLSAVNYPGPLSDPTGGTFGRPDLVQEILNLVVQEAEPILHALYSGPGNDNNPLEHCGDGTLDAALGEECDDGNLYNCDGCEWNCTLPACGNGVGCAADAEECDDGNADSEDGCTPGCILEFCGDGVLQANGVLGETCDDGNTTVGDGCSAECQTE